MIDSGRYGIWALWTLVTALGYSLGLYAGFFLAHFLPGAIGVAAIGFVVALSQRPVLQRRLEPPASHIWLPTDTAGWVAGPIAGMAAVFMLAMLATEAELFDPGRTGVVEVAGGLALVGALSGYIQARVLRRYVLASRWWIVASTAGWAASALGLGVLVPLGERVYPVISLLLAPAVSGLILGVVTGGVLVRLPLRPEPLTLRAGPRSDR